MRTGQKSQIGVHDHGRAISAPSIARKLLAVRAVGAVATLGAAGAAGAAGALSALDDAVSA